MAQNVQRTAAGQLFTQTNNTKRCDGQPHLVLKLRGRLRLSKPWVAVCFVDLLLRFKAHYFEFGSFCSYVFPINDILLLYTWCSCALRPGP